MSVKIFHVSPLGSVSLYKMLFGCHGNKKGHGVQPSPPKIKGKAKLFIHPELCSCCGSDKVFGAQTAKIICSVLLPQGKVQSQKITEPCQTSSFHVNHIKRPPIAIPGVLPVSFYLYPEVDKSFCSLHSTNLSCFCVTPLSQKVIV